MSAGGVSLLAAAGLLRQLPDGAFEAVWTLQHPAGGEAVDILGLHVFLGPQRLLQFATTSESGARASVTAAAVAAPTHGASGTLWLLAVFTQ